jgi:hypothetical protein
MGEKMNASRTLVGKLEVKNPQGKPRCRWENKLRWILDMMEWYRLD